MEHDGFTPPEAITPKAVVPEVPLLNENNAGISALKETHSLIERQGPLGHYGAIWETKAGTPEYNDHQYVVMAGIMGVMGADVEHIPAGLGGKGVAIDSSAAYTTMKDHTFVANPAEQAAAMMPLVEAANLDKTKPATLLANSLGTNDEFALAKDMMEAGFHKMHIIIDTPVGADKVGIKGTLDRFAHIQPPLLRPNDKRWIVETVWPDAATIAIAQKGKEYLEGVEQQRPLNFAEQQDRDFYEGLLARANPDYNEIGEPATDKKAQDMARVRQLDNEIAGFMKSFAFIGDPILDKQQKYQVAKMAGQNPGPIDYTPEERDYMKVLNDKRNARANLLVMDAIQHSVGPPDPKGELPTTIDTWQLTDEHKKKALMSLPEFGKLIKHISNEGTIDDIKDLQAYMAQKNLELQQEGKPPLDVDFTMITPMHDPFNGKRSDEWYQKMNDLGVKVLKLNYATHFYWASPRMSHNIVKLVDYIEGRSSTPPPEVSPDDTQTDESQSDEQLAA